MNCRQVEPLLYHDLECLRCERDAIALAAHIAQCPACRRRRAALTAVRTELHGLSTLQPPPHLARRAVDCWTAEQLSNSRQRYAEGAHAVVARLMTGRLAGRFSLAAALTLLAVIGLALHRWNHHTWRRQLPQIAGRTALPSGPVSPDRLAAHDTRPTGSSIPGPVRSPDTSSIAAGGYRREVTPQSDPGAHLISHDPDRGQPDHPDLRPLSRGIGGGGQRVGARVHVDDMAFLNGPDPVQNVRPWAPVSRDEWDAIEAKVRRQVRVRDDFVQIPFPRVASVTEGAIVAAVEQYKREAAIVDPRLFHEVTLAQKATALSDLCDHLRGDTGIQISAGPSVADEKVTIFCERMPLRDVMRQLSRPFGYTWLRSGQQGELKYELVQDLRSQLAEEELRNRDRDQALLALERDVDRYRPYLSLTPHEALVRSRTAPPAEKRLLENLASEGWGPIHVYFQLSPQEQAALRDGQELKFSQEPGPGELPLTPDLAHSVLQSLAHLRVARRDGHLVPVDPTDLDAMPLTAVSEARALVNLSLHQSELGRFNLDGSSGFRISKGNLISITGSGPYAVGISPTVREPENAATNAALARDPALQAPVTVQAQPDLTAHAPSLQGKEEPPGEASSHGSAGLRLPPPSGGAARAEPRVTSADVLEALHRATGLPIVSDFYTRLYAPDAASVKDEQLFGALNHLADAMRLRWHKDAGTREAGAWLQFRSASYYDDRLKEVPNRLLARWAASCREHGALTLDDLIEIAQLSNEQLDAVSMAEGAKEIWGLDEWDLARDTIPRRHLRFLAQCTPAQRQLAIGPGGLTFDHLSLAQQQQFITLAFAYSPAAYHNSPPDVRLEDLAGASLRVRYSLPGGFEWRAAAGPERPADELTLLWAPTREAALQSARRLDPQVAPAEIVPSERALTFLYTHGDPKTGLPAVAVRATTSGVSIYSP